MTVQADLDRAQELVREILEDLTADLDVGPVTSDRLLSSFGLESISLVYLIAEVQDSLDLGDRFVAALRSADTSVVEMRVDEFAALAAQS